MTIEGDSMEKPLVRNEAEYLLCQFSSLKTSFMTTIWSFMLHRFNVTSKRIQAVIIDLHIVAELRNSVIDLIDKCLWGFRLQKVKPYVESNLERNSLTKHHPPSSTFYHMRTSE